MSKSRFWQIVELRIRSLIFSVDTIIPARCGCIAMARYPVDADEDATIAFLQPVVFDLRSTRFSA